LNTEYKLFYRHILKAASLFGVVQAYNIVISIIRSKAVAVLIGHERMDLVG